MQSKPLKQAIDLTLDIMGMQGPVRRRDVAERVLRETTDDHWSVGDERDARLSYIQHEVTAHMKMPLSDGALSQILPRVPVQFRATIEKLPRFICISPRGGHGAEHVMSWRASPDEWDANFSLKDYVAERAAFSRDEARGVRDMLRMNDAASLEHLFNGAQPE